MNESTTRSPTANPLVPSPTSTTSPAASWPRISGGGMGIVPLVAERSEWQTPQAPSLTVTSPRRGGSTVISSMTTGLLSSRHSTARALRDILIPASSLASPQYISGEEMRTRLTGMLSQLTHQAKRHPGEQQHADDQRRPKRPLL